MCEIVPKKILKNIAKNDINPRRKNFYNSIVQDIKEKEFREKRKMVQENLLKGEGLVPKLDKNHTQHLKIFDNKSEWDYTKEHVWEEFIQVHTNNADLLKKPKRAFTKDFDKVYDMFHDILDRESFNNDNATVEIFLKLGINYPNAFWDGQYLAFGTGDHYYFNDFSRIYDVIAHEYGHANIQYECNLQYENQSGALNEHIADVFGICAYQKKYNLAVDKTEWIIGKGLFTTRVKAKGLRSFKDEIAYDDPIIGKDDQPKHMRDYQDLPNTEDGDWGGVHTNSGIPNHAFYLFNMKLGGKSWNNGSLQIWYNSMLKENGLNPYATFKEFAEKTIEISQRLTTINPVQPLEDAWREVGVLS